MPFAWYDLTHLLAFRITDKFGCALFSDYRLY
jgi:hypothetical protein